MSCQDQIKINFRKLSTFEDGIKSLVHVRDSAMNLETDLGGPTLLCMKLNEQIGKINKTKILP